MRCWARVCDELVVVTHAMRDVEAMMTEADVVGRASEAEGRRCEVLVRSVVDPPLVGFAGYGSYLLFGAFMASDPDWVLAVEADYMISPGEAARLRAALEGSKADVVMARAVTLNYGCTRKVFCRDFTRWFPPYDGFSWDRPIGCRPAAGVFPTPYNGTDRGNLTANCEGYMAVRKGKWGLSFNSKFLNHNPHGLDLLRTDVEFEHPQFTRSGKSLLGKLRGDYFVQCGIGLRSVLEGDEPYSRRYEELDRVAADYATQEDVIRKMMVSRGF
jgi:hypothetical protein